MDSLDLGGRNLVTHFGLQVPWGPWIYCIQHILEWFLTLLVRVVDILWSSKRMVHGERGGVEIVLATRGPLHDKLLCGLQVSCNRVLIRIQKGMSARRSDLWSILGP